VVVEVAAMEAAVVRILPEMAAILYPHLLLGRLQLRPRSPEA
jgi:hypothetical protein